MTYGIMEFVNHWWGNGSLLTRHQAISSTNAEFPSTGPAGTHFNNILINFRIFSFTKLHLTMFSAKWQSLCFGHIMCQKTYQVHTYTIQRNKEHGFFSPCSLLQQAAHSRSVIQCPRHTGYQRLWSYQSGTRSRQTHRGLYCSRGRPQNEQTSLEEYNEIPIYHSYKYKCACREVLLASTAHSGYQNYWSNFIYEWMNIYFTEVFRSLHHFTCINTSS